LLWAVVSIAALWMLVSALSLRVQQVVGRTVPRGPAPDQPASVSVIIPARNEAPSVEDTVRSLLAQEGVELELIVVNDGSTDGTREILDRLASEDARLRVLHDPELAEGWLGKTNAMQQGADLADNELLLFTDADIRYAPGTLSATVHAMQSEQLDYLAMLPRFEWETFLEVGMVPALFITLSAFGSTKLEDPDHPETSAGSGAFAMVRRTVYDAIGGHEAIHDAALDDIALGRLVKREGHRIGFRLSPECIRIRMYRGNKAALFAVSKNIIAALDNKVWVALPATFMVAALFLTGPIAAAAGAVAGDPRVALAGLALYGLQLLTLLTTRSWHTFPLWKLPTFPSVALIYTASIARALYNEWVHGSVEWRGRRVRRRG
jgi:GT2 family glycosyltransferase